MFRFIIHGQAGTIVIDNSRDTISIKELFDDITYDHLTYDDLVKDDTQSRNVTRYKIQRLYGVDMFVPDVGVTATATNNYNKLKDKKTVKLDKLVKIFTREQCNLAKHSKRIITLIGLSNSGGSDQATTLLIAASWKVVIIACDLDISN